MFNRTQYRIISANGTLKEMIEYLNKNPPPLGYVFIPQIMRKVTKRKIRKMGVKKLEEIILITNKNSSWRRLLDRKFELVKEGKILKFKKKEFEELLKNPNLLEITKYLNEHTPRRWEWNKYVKNKLSAISSLAFYRFIEAKDLELKEAKELARKGTKHELIISHEYSYYGRYEGLDAEPKNEK